MWVEFDHFSKLLSCCFPGYWCCSGVKQDKQTIKSKDKLQKTQEGQQKHCRPHTAQQTTCMSNLFVNI